MSRETPYEEELPRSGLDVETDVGFELMVPSCIAPLGLATLMGFPVCIFMNGIRRYWYCL